MTGFPEYRSRRLRRSEALRALVRETRLAPGRLILPLFVQSGKGVRDPITSLTGAFRLSVDEALKDAREAAAAGLGGVLLFGIPDEKDEVGSGAWDEDGAVQRARRASSRRSRT